MLPVRILFNVRPVVPRTRFSMQRHPKLSYQRTRRLPQCTENTNAVLQSRVFPYTARRERLTGPQPPSESAMIDLKAFPLTRRLQRRRKLLLGVLVLQTFCILFLLTEASLDIVGLELEEILGTQNVMEFIIVFALVAGAGVLAAEFRAVLERQKVLEDQLKAASGAFNDLLEQHFADWRLTAAERDVALLSIKGLSISEIAAARQTAEGTVKAQCNKIYGKAGVTGRPQLLSLFIEELMAEGLVETPDQG